MPSTIDLYNRLKEIDIEIKEAKLRLPAHSVKPVLMMALFALEDERDLILKQLKTRPRKPDGHGSMAPTIVEACLETRNRMAAVDWPRVAGYMGRPLMPEGIRSGLFRRAALDRPPGVLHLERQPRPRGRGTAPGPLCAAFPGRAAPRWSLRDFSRAGRRRPSQSALCRQHPQNHHDDLRPLGGPTAKGRA